MELSRTGGVVLAVLALACLPLGADPGQHLGSYTFAIVPQPDRSIKFHREVYIPAAGDIVLFDDHNKLITALYRLVGTAGPLHSAIVFNKPDGSLGMLEAGPNMVRKVFVLEPVYRMHAYNGTILVRKVKTPLSPTQSDRLSEFAMAQNGKDYSVPRLVLQITPFKARGPLRKFCFGCTKMDRDRWMCSELVCAAACSCGLLNPKVHLANAMYPRDFAYDENYDISDAYHEAVLWYPEPELKMIGNAIATGFSGDAHRPFQRRP